MSGLLIAAPASGSGKTTVTLGLLRALRRRDVAVSPGKAGPDYIDPAFHTAASGETCLNYDPWAMRPTLLLSQAARAEGKVLIVEAMMGLHDAAMDGSGSPADLAAVLGLPVVLVVDCAKMAQSVAALVRGYAIHRSDIRVAGVILNKVGSERHAAMLRGALEAIDMPVLGVLPRDPQLVMPERHLGLVQAQEHSALDSFIEGAAALVEASVDIDALIGIAETAASHQATDVSTIAPFGQKIAIARDVAFSFLYPHLLEDWRGQGAELSFFSPLANEQPECRRRRRLSSGRLPGASCGRSFSGRGISRRDDGGARARRADFRRMRAAIWFWARGLSRPMAGATKCSVSCRWKPAFWSAAAISVTGAPSRSTASSFKGH